MCVCVCVGGGEQSDTPEKTSLKISSLIRVNIVEAEEDQSNLLHEIVEFHEISRPRLKEGKDKKQILIKVHVLFMKFEN